MSYFDKKRRFGTCLFLAPAFVVSSLGAAPNPQQIALLKWNAANQTTSFTVGRKPVALAFDGANMWVANYLDNTVSKLQANDGTLLTVRRPLSMPAVCGNSGHLNFYLCQMTNLWST